jgi:hypothetical protein
MRKESAAKRGVVAHRGAVVDQRTDADTAA